MKINDKEVDVNEVIDLVNNQHLLLKRRENNILLSDYQINVLKKNNINYLNYNNLHDLLFKIEEVLYGDYEEELDLVASQISELLYYNETKK